MAATITLCVCIIVCAVVDNTLHEVTGLCVDYKHMYSFLLVQDTSPQSRTIWACFMETPSFCFINAAECKNSCRHKFAHAKLYEHP